MAPCLAALPGRHPCQRGSDLPHARTAWKRPSHFSLTETGSGSPPRSASSAASISASLICTRSGPAGPCCRMRGRSATTSYASAATVRSVRSIGCCSGILGACRRCRPSLLSCTPSSPVAAPLRCRSPRPSGCALSSPSTAAMSAKRRTGAALSWLSAGRHWCGEPHALSVSRPRWRRSPRPEACRPGN